MGVGQDGEVWPMLWQFADGTTRDLPLGKELIATAQQTLGKGTIRPLLVDAGLLDGDWLGELAASMTVTIHIREDMETPRREVCGFSELTSWSSCSVPLSGCLVRDTYGNKAGYWAMAQTGNAEARTVYRAYRKRWDLEETFMAATRYGQMESRFM